MTMKICLNRLCALLVAAMTLLAGACPALAWDARSWQYQKELKSEQDGFVLINLDQSVMEHARYGFEDLRLVDAAGAEVSYQLLERGAYSKASYDSRILDVAVVKGEANLLSLDIGESGHLHNRIEMEISCPDDYLRNVSIEGSDDNSNWKSLGEDKLFRVGQDYRKSYLQYPDSSYRYIRLAIASQGEKPLTVLSARVFWESVANHGQFQPIPVNISSLENNDRDQATELIIDLGVKGYQVEKVVLEVDGRNYHRQVQLSTSTDQKEWPVLAEGQVMSYKWDDYEYRHNEVKAGAMCPRYLRLKISNQDSAPLDIKGLEVWACRPQILADLKPGDYSIWYGNSSATAPVYDLQAFSPMIALEQLPVLETGQESINPDYRAPEEPWTERNRWLLNVVLIMAALALGAAIFRALRSTEPA